MEDLNTYTDPDSGVTVVIPDEVWVERGGKIANSLRQSKGGPTPVYYTCPFCKKEMTAREWRVHKSRCPKRDKFAEVEGRSVLFPCQFCGEQFGSKDIEKHLVICKKNPRNRRRSPATA